jgi:hypothetical protein
MPIRRLVVSTAAGLLVGVCGHAPTDVIFRWAKAKRVLHVKF